MDYKKAMPIKFSAMGAFLSCGYCLEPQEGRLEEELKLRLRVFEDLPGSCKNGFEGGPRVDR